ncbi:hypothetical protein OE165_28860, partial [Escherichia coli]|uniref:hypothetical protein n=1 Tax=Escherichia coli TaxID=562 RepID=UPI0021F3C4A5
ELISISYIKDQAYRDAKSRLKFSKIKDAFKDVYKDLSDKDSVTGKGGKKSPLAYPLSPVKNKLGNSFSFKDIRLAR